MQRYDVLNMGLVIVDIPVKVPVQVLDFTADTIRIPDLHMIPGGDAANSSIILGQLGKAVSLTAAVGDDSFGGLLVAELGRRGVDTSRVCTKPGVVTGVSLVLVNDAGQRTCVCTRGNNRELVAGDFDLSLLRSGARHLNVSSLFGHPKLEADLPGLLAQAREVGLATSADVGYDRKGRGFTWVRPVIEQLDYFFLSHEQAAALTGERDPARQARYIVNNAGERTVVITLGQEGCFVHEPGREFRVPAFPVEAVDTTGAGDTFLAAMVSALLDGRDVEGSARYANAAAAVCVQYLGAAPADVVPGRIDELLGE